MAIKGRSGETAGSKAGKNVGEGAGKSEPTPAVTKSPIPTAPTTKATAVPPEPASPAVTKAGAAAGTGTSNAVKSPAAPAVAAGHTVTSPAPTALASRAPAVPAPQLPSEAAPKKAAPAGSSPAAKAAPTPAKPEPKPEPKAEAKPAATPGGEPAAPGQAAPADVQKPAPGTPPAAPSAPVAPSTPAAKAPAAPVPPAPSSVAPAAPKLPPLSPAELAPDGDAAAVLSADHRDPFSFLGLHVVQPSGRLVVRALLPQAKSVAVVDRASGEVLATLERVREEGLFAAAIDRKQAPFAYRLRLETAHGSIDIDDPYRFPPVLADEDVQLLAEGDHFHSYDKLGAHPLTLDGVAGLAFAVWAPNAARVSVIGSFNDWDGRRHGMRLRHDCGVWEIFIPGIGAGELYKYEIKTPTGVRLPDKCDPYAFFVEPSPGSAAIACDLGRHAWCDRGWMQERSTEDARRRPISVYQLHIGSWRRRPEEGNRPLTYRELGDELVDYLAYMAFTHVELLPINEFDFDASLGFQPFVPYAPTSRWGTPADLQYFVDRCHQAGIGVILDWVPNHFSDDPHGLRSFDGTHLYEHPDPQRRKHPATNTLNYDHGRREISNYLISNALFWMEHYHIDGLCVSSLPAMLYLDYGRHRGEWTANRFGGHENLEAVDFLRRLNEKVYERYKPTFPK